MSTETVYEDLRTEVPEEVTIKQALTRGVHDVLPEETPIGTLEQQMEDRRLTLYLGIDPTSPNLHIGHSVPLRKLRQFQDLGHDVVLLFGTFTGMIGDPTDKSATRKQLTREQIDANVSSYVEQASRVLDMSENAPNPTRIAYNHEWLGKMTFAEVVDLMSNFTTSQMLARSMFQDRVENNRPIWLHELTYPLMQGWDSVALGVDLEIGGKDQTFNMLVGRDLLARYSQKEKWVMATKLIEDPTGKKMGKTEGNIVNIRDFCEWKYESIMTWPDSAIGLGFELLTSIPMDQVNTTIALLESGELHPMEVKRALAYRVVYELDGKEAADYSELEFDRVMRKGEEPQRMLEVVVPQDTDLASALVLSGLSPDLSDAQRLVASRSVYIDGKKITSNVRQLQTGTILKTAKRTIKNIRRIKI